MKKKALALILGTLMVGSVAVGFVGCKRKKPNTPTIDGFKRLADPRDQGAFEVYSKDGTKVGSFPSIARAINAAVENDLDEFESAGGVSATARGSYVTKKGSTRKIFENMKKYSEDVSADNFWYYENNSLAGMEYYIDKGGIPYNRAQNTKAITYKTSSGTSTVVANSSYGLYDGLGQPIEQSTYNLGDFAWELIPMTDANIKGVPVREKGATGAKYVLDLSDVKIKPAYAGVEDDVYAFIGYTVGAGNYSVDIGLACNVNTGEWKQYVSHNPNNNVEDPAVTVEYNIGKTVFGSKWNKEGGYFTPNVGTVTLEIKEVKDEDDLGMPWWYNKLEITLEKETKPAVTVIVDDEYLKAHGNSAKFDTKNGFYFSAGLDIVEKGAQLHDDVKATDYTIGATFENLVVDEAYIYFPAEDEISDEDYGGAINPDYKGQYKSIRTSFEGREKGVYNYTILALNACIDYELTDGKDTYSFRYDNYENAESAFAGQLKTYQDKIDALSSITKETAGSYQTALNEVAEWLGPDGNAEEGKVGDPATGKIPKYCYHVIDWQPYFDAYKVFLSAVKLTEEGKQFLNDFNELTAINNVSEWKGWKALDGAEDTKGYLWNELQIFAGLAERYGALGEDDQFGIKQLVGALWYSWVALNDDYNAMLETQTEFATKDFTIPTETMTGTVTMTGEELVGEFFKYAFNAYLVTKGESHTDHGGALCVENSAGVNHFNNTFRMYFLDWFLKEQGIDIGYCEDIITMLKEHCIGSGAGSHHDFQYIANVSKQLNRIIAKDCIYLDEELAEMINEYMVGFAWQNGSWDWAFSVNGGDLNMQNLGWKKYFGEAIGAQSSTFRSLIHEYLKPIIERDSDATIVDYTRPQGTFPGMAVSKKVTAIKFELSTNGTAWGEEWKALNDIGRLAGWKGWKSADTSDLNYVYNSLTKALELIDEFDGLSASDKALLNTLYEDAMAIWKKISTEYAALEANTTTILVWDEDYSTQKSMKVADVFGAFIDHVFNINVITTHKSGQGYLCMADGDGAACGANTFYTLYLHKLLELQELDFDYFDTVVELLKDQGDDNNNLTGVKAGTGAFIDYDYFWNIGKQIGRIVRGEVDYLDAELVKAINEYMVANRTGGTTGYGTNNCFYNGTSAWFYYKGTPGKINGYGVNWMTAIDADLAGVTGAGNKDWGAAIKYVTDIIEAAGFGNLLVLPSNGDRPEGVPPMLVSGPVSETMGPDALDDIEATVEAIVDIFTKFGFHDLTDPFAWTAGATKNGTSRSAIYDSVQMFKKIYTVYATLAADKQAAVKAQCTTFEAWIDLMNQFNELGTEKNISIVSENMKDHELVSELDLVNEFFNIVFKTYDTTIAHDTPKNKFGFLCMQHANCFELSMRALYLNKLIEINTDFEFTADMLDVMANLESTGKSKYTGTTETLNAIYDFDYLWNMSIQINRILSGKCTYLDDELVDAINKYMYGDKTAGLGDANARCASSFYHMSLSYMYRNSNGCISKLGGDSPWEVTGWEIYFGLPESNGNWANLIKHVNDLIRADSRYAPAGEKDSTVLVACAPEPMLTNTLLEAATLDLGDFEGVTTAEALIQKFTALQLNDLKDVTSGTWLGGKSATGSTSKYIYDEVMMFKNAYLAYTLKLSADEQTLAEANATFKAWVELYEAYDALGTASTISVPNEALTGYTTMSELEVVNEFFNNLFASYDATVAHTKTGNLFGYLCGEHEECFKHSMRAMYLYKMITVNDIDFELADDMIDAMKVLESTKNSKYTGITETANMLLDFEYLWNMSAQIKRVRDKGIMHLDEELVEAINEYMYGDKTNKFDGNVRCAGSFYSLALSDDFRTNGGKISTVTGWGLYFGLGKDENNWGELIGTINEIIAIYDEYENIFVKTTSESNSYTMLIDKEVEKKDPIQITPEAEAIIAQFHEYSELDKLSAWKGWTGTERGYVGYELGLFKTLYQSYTQLDKIQQRLVVKGVNANKWALWETLYNEYEALDETPVNIWDNAFNAENVSKTKAELVAMFVDGAFWAKRENHIDTNQGYFCMEHDASAINAVYTMYLSQALKANVTLAYRDTVLTMLKGQGQNFVADYEYVWNVGKQIVRVMGGLKYIDEELANVVNTYMVQATRTNFNNGTWSYFYGGGAGGYIGPKLGSKNWLKAIDQKLYDVVGGYSGWAGSNWSLAMAYLTGPDGLLTRKGNVQYNEFTFANPLFVKAPVKAQEAPKLNETAQEVVNGFDGLSEINKLSGMKGWAAPDSETTGYLKNELETFATLYTKYSGLDADQKELIEDNCGSSWAIWVKLNEQYATFKNDQKKVSVWKSDYSAREEKDLVDVWAAFIDGVFWYNVNHSTCDQGQGNFCQEHDASAANSIYTLYLNKVLEGENVKMDYRGYLINLLKNDTQDFVSDFEYVWNVGKQIARVIGGLKYIDEALMTVVNEYMVSASKNNFNNGTWSWFYGNANGGQGAMATKVSKAWYKSIDEQLYTFMNGDKNWSDAMAYLTGADGLLTKAGYSDQYNNTPKAGINALFLKTTVSEGKDPDAYNSVEKIVAAINGLSDLTNAAPTNWLGGISDTYNSGKYKLHYFYDEFELFGEYKAAAEALEEGAKLDEIKEQVGATKYEKWATLYTKYAALKADQTKYDIVNGDGTTVHANTVSVRGLDIVRAFFTALYNSYDDEHNCAAFDSTAKFGYLGTETQAGIYWSLRALYLNNLIKTTEAIDFPFADEFLTAAANYCNGETDPAKRESKYVGTKHITETQCVIEDFNYFLTMAAQIKRIKALGTPLSQMDEELKGIVDNYCATRFIKGMRTGKPNDYAVSNLLFSLGIAVAYRDNKNGFEKGDWTRYIGLDGTATFSNLMKDVINPLVTASGYTLITPGSGSTSAALMYEAPATTENGAQED